MSTDQDVATPTKFKQYRKKNLAELRPYEEGEDMSDVSIALEDKNAGSPKVGDMIARNPNNHNDQWLISQAYFEKNFEPAPPSDPNGNLNE